MTNSDTWPQHIRDRIRRSALMQKPKHRTPQPGDMLKWLISKLGIPQTVGCRCAKFQRQMNAWGYWGCYRHRREIYKWLAIKAAERGIEISEAAFWPLFRAALRQARLKS